MIWSKYFKLPTPEESWKLHENEIELSFSDSFKGAIDKEIFLEAEWQKKFTEIRKLIPNFIYEYVYVDLINEDFIRDTSYLLIVEDGFLFITKKYLEKYSNFLIEGSM